MGTFADLAVALLLIIGAVFSLLGSLGLVRFSDVLLRLHGPTKAGTLGVGCILVASALHFSLTGPGISVHELLITLFLFLTAPVSAHLMAKCALFLAARRHGDVSRGREGAAAEPKGQAPDRDS